MKTALLLLALALFGSANAAPLVTGSYQFSVQLSPVLLNGRYPVFVNEGLADRTPIEGRLELATAPNGKLTGKVDIFAEIGTVTGSIKIRKDTTKLRLRGKTATGKRISVTAKLTGATFTGTVKLGKFKGPLRLDIDGIAATKLEYTLAVTVAPNGKITGTGTVTTDMGDTAVTVQGKTDDDSAKLTIKGGKTMFEGKGPTTATGFTAKWVAQSYGALLKGDNLPVTQ